MTRMQQEVIERFSPRVTRVFQLYVQRMLAKRFNGGPQCWVSHRARCQPSVRVIFYSNHPGWYDPLVMLLVAHPICLTIRRSDPWTLMR